MTKKTIPNYWNVRHIVKHEKLNLRTESKIMLAIALSPVVGLTAALIVNALLNILAQ